MALIAITAERLFAGSGIGVGVVGSGGLRLRSGLTLSGYILVEAVKTFGLSTVKVEPKIICIKKS